MTETLAQVRIRNEYTKPIKLIQGLKHGDGLTPLLFNPALQYAIRQMTVDRSEVLYHISVQIRSEVSVQIAALLMI